MRPHVIGSSKYQLYWLTVGLPVVGIVSKGGILVSSAWCCCDVGIATSLSRGGSLLIFMACLMLVFPSTLQSSKNNFTFKLHSQVQQLVRSSEEGLWVLFKHHITVPYARCLRLIMLMGWFTRCQGLSIMWSGVVSCWVPPALFFSEIPLYRQFRAIIRWHTHTNKSPTYIHTTCTHMAATTVLPNYRRLAVYTTL